MPLSPFSLTTCFLVVTFNIFQSHRLITALVRLRIEVSNTPFQENTIIIHLTMYHLTYPQNDGRKVTFARFLFNEMVINSILGTA